MLKNEWLYILFKSQKHWIWNFTEELKMFSPPDPQLTPDMVVSHRGNVMTPWANIHNNFHFTKNMPWIYFCSDLAKLESSEFNQFVKIKHIVSSADSINGKLKWKLTKTIIC